MSSQKPIHLLDLSEKILKNIIWYVAYEDRGIGPEIQSINIPSAIEQDVKELHDPVPIPPIPEKILPLSTTCSKLRNLCSFLLYDDKIWDFAHPTYIRVIDEPRCEHFSNDINQPITKVSPGECQDYSCPALQKELAWYSLSMPHLKSFLFSRLYEVFYIREAVHLVRKIILNRAPIKKLDFQDDVELSPTQVIPICNALQQLISAISNSLEIIRIHTYDSCKWKVGEALCSHPLPALKQIEVSLLNDENNVDVQFLNKLLNHAQESNARITTLILTATAKHFKKLRSFLSLCPHLENLVLNMPFDEFRFPSAESMKNFKIKTLRVQRGGIEEKHMKEMSKYIVQNEHISEVHFESICFSNLVDIFDEYNFSFGQKIRSLIIYFDEECDSTRLERIGTYCTNLETLSISCQNSDASFRALKHILAQLKHLRIFCLYIGESEESESGNMKELVEGMEESTASLEVLNIGGIEIQPQLMYRMMVSFSDSLILCSCLNGNTGIFNKPQDVLRVLKLIQEGNRLTKLRRLEVELREILPFENATVEVEAMKTEIEELCKKMRMQFKHFDETNIIEQLSLCNSFPGDGVVEENEEEMEEMGEPGEMDEMDEAEEMEHLDEPEEMEEMDEPEEMGEVEPGDVPDDDLSDSE